MCSEHYLPYSLKIDINEITHPNLLIRIISEEEIAFPIDTDNSLAILTIYCPEDPEIRDI